jgi:hypothetical protein
MLAREAEARIVRGMTDDEDDPLADLAHPVETVTNQATADTPALVGGRHRHRRQRCG